MDFETRRLAEQQMAMQDKLRTHKGRRAGAFMEDDEYSEQDEVARQIRMERMKALNQGAGGDEDMQDGDQEMLQDVLDLEDVKGKLSQWVQRPEVVRWIRKSFSSFLRNFKDDNGASVYEERIREMCANNKQSLEITFIHLSQRYPFLAIWLAEEPSLMLPILNEVALEVTLELFADYHLIHHTIYARIRDLPVEDKLRDLRQIHLNALIKIRGVVTKRTGVFPEYSRIFYRCSCGDLKGPVYHNNPFEGKQFLGQCVVCQSNGPFTVDEINTVYRNYQKMTIQETPGTVPPGRVPRQKEVYVLNDQVDAARPGDEVEITGIYINRFDYFSNVKHGFPVFTTIIEANYIRRFGDEDIIELTEEDKLFIRNLSRQPKIGEKIINSIAPSIYGHNFVKKALALAMFGGEAKDINGKHRIRGDINVLLLGDPGTAKSQFLKYVEQVFHRCVYTTGKGASAVGLTAGVHKDPVSREWTLEGGALVLADKGICLIDEFDKMNDQDRTSIHEAMEQQSISISKAGIVTSLQARCSVIAAANPIKGTYNTTLNFTDNVDLTEPILSRFDVLSVIKDEVNEEQDDALATFVINSHMKNHPEIARDMNLNDEDLQSDDNIMRKQHA
jgi:DNA replication licensing factor MCM2